MFEDVKHQNERVLFAGTKSFIEGANVDAVAIRVVRADHIRGQFNSLHIAELHQFAEKEAVSATDVENRTPASRRLIAAKKLDNQFFTRAEPPVSFVQSAVAMDQFRVQSGSRVYSFATGSRAGVYRPLAAPNGMRVNRAERRSVHARSVKAWPMHLSTT